MSKPTHSFKYQTASQSNLPPEAPSLFDDELIAARTRFSPGRTHRYTLFRYWGNPDRYIAFAGMNPSGADLNHDDRTVSKCVRFGRRWSESDPVLKGIGAMYMLNAFSLRATNSDELYEHADPVGPDNDFWIREIASKAERVIVAWGKPGGDFKRGEAMIKNLEEACDPSKVFCFGFNLDGTPVHPLYQKESKQLIPFFRT